MSRPKPTILLEAINLPLRNIFPEIGSSVTEQSRAMLPAWQLRDLEQNHLNYLHSDPQKHTEILFPNNISSRILEKDNFKQKYHS